MEKKSGHKKLGQWAATAICGNDILSSCLYVSGIAVIYAGVYAPLVLVIIVAILFFYKSVYTEVVEALPINGGAYNCLLNATSKSVAAVAGVLTMLSYIATAVLSGKVSIEYLHTIVPQIPVIPATIALLFFFALLVIGGIKDSAKLALGIFILHIVSLVSFVALGGYTLFTHHTFFLQNLLHTTTVLHKEGGIVAALFLGFSASLLGVSGFESSANFVEEQDEGVFRKTLRNMLIGVAIFNPLIALIILGLSPLSSIVAAKDFLLSQEAAVMGGHYFQIFIVIDAFLVLAGAVLTSFVGVTGLIYRMASDACLPGFLTKRSKSGSHPRIIILFFLLCASILILTGGNILSLAGVYTIAFLGVMSMFALGNLILRETRTELKRTYNAPAVFVIVAFLATLSGIAGNIKIDTTNLFYFAIYFIPAIIIVMSIVFEDLSLRIILRLTKNIGFVHRYIEAHFEDLTSGRVIAFVNHVERLYPLLHYINSNETAWNITLVHCANHDNKDDRDRFKEIKNAIPHLQAAGAFPHFKIDCVYKDFRFGPQAVKAIAKEYKSHTNRILIGSIHHFHEFDYEELGGVRIIF
ncbi:MAG TPA: APC family permease [Patescibacteria group bacterium]|nr:APC family permease [Patescibacteria group bacterium]